jgi:hypothetical protein
LGTTFYYYEESDIQNSFLLFYITKNEASAPQLHMQLKYLGDDWMFINGYTFNVDDDTYTSRDIYFDVARDIKLETYSYGDSNNTYKDTVVYELYDTVLDENQINMFKNIINSKQTSFQVTGKNFNSQFKLSDEVRTAMEYLLDKFKKLQDMQVNILFKHLFLYSSL